MSKHYLVTFFSSYFLFELNLLWKCGCRTTYLWIETKADQNFKKVVCFLNILILIFFLKMNCGCLCFLISKHYLLTVDLFLFMWRDCSTSDSQACWKAPADSKQFLWLGMPQISEFVRSLDIFQGGRVIANILNGLFGINNPKILQVLAKDNNFRKSTI